MTMSILLPKKASRRAVLRGMLGGASLTLGLPILDSHLNSSGTAFADTGASLPVRFGTWYWGMGHTPGHAIGAKNQTARGIEFLEETAPLRRYADYINYFGDFNVPLDGRSNYTHFTGWVCSRTGSAPDAGNEIPAPTLDLLIADEIGKGTRFPTIDASSSGIARENYSARGTHSRAETEISPVRLYARLFGEGFTDPNTADFVPDPRVMARRSVLSAFTDQTRDYMKTISMADRQRLDEYFTSIRQVENQLAMQLEPPAPAQACLIPGAPAEALDRDAVASSREIDTVRANHRIMAELLAMAVACNQTRVFNMAYVDNFANVRRAGESYTHHMLTHEEPIDTDLGYQPLAHWFQLRSMEALADYIEVFSRIPEGDGTLLDNVLIYASTETNYARVHTLDALPGYSIGKAGGRIKTGYHVVGGGDPVTRVGLTLQQVMGVRRTSWGTRSLETSRPLTDILA
jgi:hypothetical protein